MRGRSDIKGGMGVATTWALAITGDPCFLLLRNPSRGQWHAYRKGAWGLWELEAPRHLLTLRRMAFGICIKQLTMNRLWKRGITPHVAGPESVPF
jgi:hypothetical protein